MSFEFKGKAAMKPREAAEYIARKGYVKNKKRLPHDGFITSIMKHLENQGRFVRDRQKNKLPYIELGGERRKGRIAYYVHQIDEHYSTHATDGLVIDPGQTAAHRER